jgi:pyrroline-5-carboxylate reductase
MTSLQSRKIGCIGVGNMGGAIISGISGSVPSSSLFIFDADRPRAEKLSALCGASISGSAREMAETCDIIIIAVKPGIVPEVLEEIKPFSMNRTIVSIAAGITIERMESILGGDRNIIRAMPNTPALVREGMTVIASNRHTDEASLNAVREIFSGIGTALIMPESQLDAVTGVSGSGPAYVFTFIQAMADGAVKMGIPRGEALTLAAQTVLGAAKMVLEEKQNPISLRDSVTSPGGTTIDAVHVLEQRGFSGAIMSAIEAATEKSRLLGKKK